MHVVHARFRFSSEDGRNDFLNTLAGPEGLAKTRAWHGCYDIEVLRDQASNDLVIAQKWESQADHEAYLSMRVETGLLALVGEKLVGGVNEGLVVTRLDPVGV